MTSSSVLARAGHAPSDVAEAAAAADAAAPPAATPAVAGASRGPLRLTDVVDAFRRAGRRIDLESASLILDETGGWPELVGFLAQTVDAADDESLERELRGAMAGELADSWLAAVLGGFGEGARHALSAVAPSPWFDLGVATSLAGWDDASALIAHLDAGALPHRHANDGRRWVAPMLRRHLLRRMSDADRQRAARSAAKRLLDEGAADDAACALASGRCWTDLADLLTTTREAGGRPGRWTSAVPAHIARALPQLSDAVERAGEDAAAVEPRRGGGAGADRPGDDAVRRLLRGDVTAAIAPLRRAVRSGATDRERITAHLGLLIIRAPLASPDATFEGCCAVERDASEAGLEGLARLARGAIAAFCLPGGRTAIRAVVERFEQAGDGAGACLAEGFGALAALRGRRADVTQLIGLAARCDRLGAAAPAAWAHAAAAMVAAAGGCPGSDELRRSAESAAIAIGLPGARAMLDAAAAYAGGDGAAGRAASARRRALETGMPRLPLPADLPSRPARVASPTVATARTGSIGRLTVACFGGFRLRIDGDDADLRSVRPQARAVLRMLALNAGTPVHRELIAEVLWGELGPESALHALHVSVSSLRRLLPAAGDAPTSIVEREGEAYRLGIAERDACDLGRFDAHLTRAAAAKAGGDLAAARDGLVGALDLYTGEVLPEDGPAEWALGARDRYRLRAAEAAASLAHLHARFGDHRSAVAVARRAVEIDPWLDESWRTLVAMHGRAGDVIAARRAEEGYRRMRADLGVE